MIRTALLTLAALASAAVATTMSGTMGEVTQQAQVTQTLKVGDSVPAELIHEVVRPGLYGIGDPAPGMIYAVVGSSLVRMNPETRVILAIIRPVAPR